jgi:sirohydrochlorin ferrochelatase
MADTTGVGARFDGAPPTLIYAPHGTGFPPGLAVLHELAGAVQAARPEHRVRTAFLDVARPRLSDVLDDLTGPSVVVPAVLSSGYHVHSDLPQVLAGRNCVRAAMALGPSRRIGLAVADRLSAARGHRPAAELVVLVAAGSSDPSAQADLRVAAADLAAILGGPVELAVLSGPGARLGDVVGSRRGDAVEVATYLLGPGHFEQELRATAAELGIVTIADPIGAHPAVVDQVWRRYDAVVAKPTRAGR